MSARSIRRSRIVGSTVAAIVALAAALGGAAPAGAEPPPPVAKYVALGDSYAAGQGAGVPLDQCLRSTAAYPVLLDAEPRTNLLRFAACTGATIDDVLSSQLSQVNRGTTLVTVTVGANDLGAGAAYAVCVPDPASLQCTAAIQAVFEILQSGVIAEDLTALILAIGERAPNAHIVVTDYPIPFADGLGTVTDTVNLATLALNEQIAEAVQAAAALGADVELASVQLAFLGHGVGSLDPWLGDDPSDPVSFLHPTPAGQQVYLAAILAALAD
ncbi:lysophospholipase L1-like esterase [Agromyces flavus]|uniref:Lysophospholipase L1 n=1 Tax=Agromyces flavus TaxID=589382 RepID=A0A1H1V1G6_9MICO|nr:SGNH/GDSL hydrolase family protein [Agromyces flavus]MCP2368094.1 lysophospholipase L1-like esterase [Agromyces flavus]GGI47555.1 lipase 1 [Agromyces flavus]SDS78594.1 Lysophospholipase L1 [Agromyces flavus]